VLYLMQRVNALTIRHVAELIITVELLIVAHSNLVSGSTCSPVLLNNALARCQLRCEASESAQHCQTAISDGGNSKVSRSICIR